VKHRWYRTRANDDACCDNDDTGANLRSTHHQYVRTQKNLGQCTCAGVVESEGSHCPLFLWCVAPGELGDHRAQVSCECECAQPYKLGKTHLHLLSSSSSSSSPASRHIAARRGTPWSTLGLWIPLMLVIDSTSAVLCACLGLHSHTVTVATTSSPTTPAAHHKCHGLHPCLPLTDHCTPM
jgi:hypothetical protein